MRFMVVLSVLFFCPLAFAQDALVFDIDKLCKWQNENNSMDIAECATLEQEGKAFIDANAAAIDAARNEECKKETATFASDPGVASYAIYADCLKNGPGSLDVAPSP